MPPVEAQRRVYLPEPVEIRLVIVEHDQIRFFGRDSQTPLMLVYRENHPGAGITLEIADSVRVENDRADA